MLQGPSSCVLQHILHPSHPTVLRTWPNKIFCNSAGNQTGTKAYVPLVLFQNGIKVQLQCMLKPVAPKPFYIYLYNQKATQKLPLLFGIDQFPFYLKIKIKSDEILSTWIPQLKLLLWFLISFVAKNQIYY